MACSSCRTFFRRAVLQKSELYQCEEGDSKCEIDSKSWKSCKKCRYEKCLKAGMDKIKAQNLNRDGRGRKKMNEHDRDLNYKMEMESILSLADTLSQDDIRVIDHLLLIV